MTLKQVFLNPTLPFIFITFVGPHMTLLKVIIQLNRINTFFPSISYASKPNQPSITVAHQATLSLLHGLDSALVTQSCFQSSQRLKEVHPNSVFEHFTAREGFNEVCSRASLVAQWLRICLPVQGTRVRALVWEDPTCHGAAGPVSHNY